MATSMTNFSEILLRRGVVSPDQVTEADQMSRETNSSLAECLTKLGYATGEEVTQALAESVSYTHLTLPTKA